jgi:hypothetical protein
VGLFVFSAQAFADDMLARAKNENWASDRQWLRLVQYQENTFGGVTSPAESAKFFLSAEGKTNPELELVATIQALQENTKLIKSRDGKFEDPVACVFPARKLWLERKSGQNFPAQTCERFDRFKEILQPQSLTYVFSSYYLNNPASAFGHTFLRINKAPSAKDGERYELADYGVGYAALQVSNNPFVYSFLGVSGLMPGAFDINPYYFKVREYNDFESRDLWEYDLHFTPEQVEMVVAYIWELLDVSFNYHYFSQNCSYRILSIFEVARGDLELTSVQKAQVMPADTVQTLYQVPGLVGRIHYRPSVRATFETRFRTLNDVEKAKLRTFARNESLPGLGESVSENEKRHSLDAAIDYLDYQYPKDIMRKKGKYLFKKEILETRAEMGGISEMVKLEPPLQEAPHDAQGSRRLGFGYRDWNREKSYLLEAKMALHDLLDPKYGYPPTAQITMGYLGISYSETTRELALDKIILYEVVSLAPVDDFTRGTSWRLKFSLERGYENNCISLCRWTELSGGSGATKTFWKNLDASLWMRINAMTSNDFIEDTWRIGAGPGASLRWNKDKFAVLAETYYRYDYKGMNREFRQNTLGLNWSLAKSLSLRATAEDTNSIQRVDLRALYYY